MQAKLVQITRARFRNKGNEYSFSLLTRVTSTHLAMLIGSPVHLWLWPKGQLRVTQYSISGKKCQKTLRARVLEKGR